MLSKSHYRAKSALRRPMSDVSNEGYDNQARFLIKDANQTVESKGSLDRLLVVRSELSDLINQIDNLVSQAIKQKEISKKGYQEIESFIGFLSGMCSSLKPWFARLQEAFMNTSTVKSKDQIKNCSTPFPLKTKLTGNTSTPQNVTISQSLTTPYPCMKSQQSILSNKTNSKQLDLLVSPSPLVSWRADHCTVVDDGKQLFLLTPVQKSQLQISKSMPATKPLITVQETGTHKKHENNIQDSIQISRQKRETGFLQTSRNLLPTKTSIFLPDTCTSKTNERHGKDGISNARSMSNLRFCSTSKTMLPTKPLSNITGTSGNCEKDFKDRVPISELVHEAGICGLSNSVLPRKTLTKIPDMSAGKMHEKDEENWKPITEPVHGLKGKNQKEEFHDTFDWFFSPPKTCVLMEPLDEKKPKELPTPVDKNKRKGDSCEKSLDKTAWNSLYMSATCTKKGETTLKRELWIRFEAASPGDLRLNADIFQKKDGKGFLDLLDEASN